MCTITETLIQTRKLTGYKGFACEYILSGKTAPEQPFVPLQM